MQLKLGVRRIVKGSPILMRMAVPMFRAKSIALAHIPLTGAAPAFTGETRLASVSFSSMEEFESWRQANSILLEHWLREDSESVVPGRFSFSVPGRCALCDKSVDFLTTIEYGKEELDGTFAPNWREQLICTSCGIRNRMRAALQLAVQDHSMASADRIYITEQFGSGYRWLRGRFRHVVGSEYIAPQKPSGYRKFGINHQDVQQLSFPKSSFDFVLSFDVLEHVPDYLSAFAAFARVLRPGGKLIMTVPFTIGKYATTVRAVQGNDGHIEHLLPIELHGNPTDPINGSLCYRHFGWDTLQKLSTAGFRDARVQVYHSRALGYLGGIQSLIVAMKA